MPSVKSNLFLLIQLPLNFPQAAPFITCLPLINHQSFDKQGRSVKNWQINFSLTSVLKELENELTGPVSLLSRDDYFDP